ncbi:MAG: bifunctional glutamate N-acetyltransferase/amino-acid acetyltransferase ArgJ [Sciscionella sp.]
MTVTSPKGFRASGVTAGLKPSGTPDVAVVVNDGPSNVAAAVYTANRCKANPVLWSEQVTADGKARAVVLNSGGANCYTGSKGFQAAHASAELVGELLGVGASEVVVCSTGLIGEKLSTEKLLAGVDAAVGVLSEDGGQAAADAILTTDTHGKQASNVRDGWRVGGMAKGAGMLAPSLATMLVVLTTDAEVTSEVADRALRAATRVTFDRLDSDGCMSTNDTVLLMCSGASGITPDEAGFTASVREVCHDLARQLLGDAEGSEHDIEIEVVHAASESDAVEVGRSIARSNLFKCAVFGKDPNWGRILASVGTTNAAFDPFTLDVAFNGVWVCLDGEAGEPQEKVNLSDRAVRVLVDLKAGERTATIWTNDLTHAYVHENSAYST